MQVSIVQVPYRRKSMFSRSMQKPLCSRWGTAAAFLLLTVASGCKSLPAVEIAQATPSSQAVRVMDAGGHIQEQPALAVATSAGAGVSPVLRHHLALVEAQGGPPMVADNSVKLLIDGPAAYAAMFGAIAAARDNINLEVYIFENDEVGQRLVQLLLRKQREGVQVNIIYDSLGSLSTPPDLFAQLRDAGAQVLEYHPINPLDGKLLDLNNRDHRKIVIVDGKVAYTGGINISSVYSSGSSSPKRKKLKTEEGWRDTQIEVRGPAVVEFQRLFQTNWLKLDGTELAPEHYFPTLTSTGDKLVEVIGSSTNDKVNLIYSDWLSAISQSQRSVHLTMAYFGPDQRTIDALKNAAKRGVDVTLVLPGFSDLAIVFQAGRSHYTELLNAGVKIYERRDSLLHAKTAVIDGVWSAVGSANMDMRSFLHNDEVNAIVLSDEFGSQMEAMFVRDVGEATPITKANWDDRPVGQRLEEMFCRLWAYWL